MASGSSPRARGTLAERARLHLVQRFIPASAGNTQALAGPAAPGAVHPRERGEHSSSRTTSKNITGSSPRARGTRQRRRWHRVHVRFIPASAGNTRPRRQSRRDSTVHPRERGEHRRRITAGARGCGSSPRARGTLHRCAAISARSRFIPASAGNTSSPGVTPSECAVHPRERGEHVRLVILGYWEPGSSPRARGTHGHSADGHLRPRFIPASAGNTRCSRGRSSGRTVHPRERGEHRRR